MSIYRFLWMPCVDYIMGLMLSLRCQRLIFKILEGLSIACLGLTRLLNRIERLVFFSLSFSLDLIEFSGFLVEGDLISFLSRHRPIHIRSASAHFRPLFSTHRNSISWPELISHRDRPNIINWNLQFQKYETIVVCETIWYLKKKRTNNWFCFSWYSEWLVDAVNRWSW